MFVGPGSVYIANTKLQEGTTGKLEISGVSDIVVLNSSLPPSTKVSDAANSAALYANGAFVKANAAFDAANNVAPQIEPAFTNANAAFLKANSAYASQNTTGTYANNAYVKANAAFIQANAAFDAANNVAPQIEPAFSKANAAFLKANSAYESQNTTGTYANAAFLQSNAAFNKANTSIQTSGINSITSGSLTITNTGGVGLTVTGNAVFNNDISVAGNVYIGGNATTFSANNITVNDSIIYVANNNSGRVDFTSEKFTDLGTKSGNYEVDLTQSNRVLITVSENLFAPGILPLAHSPEGQDSLYPNNAKRCPPFKSRIKA